MKFAWKNYRAVPCSDRPVCPPANPPVEDRTLPVYLRTPRARALGNARTYASIRDRESSTERQSRGSGKRPGIARGNTEVSGVDCLVPAAIRIPSSRFRPRSVLAPPSLSFTPYPSPSAGCLSLFSFIFASSTLLSNVSREFSSFFFLPPSVSPSLPLRTDSRGTLQALFIRFYSVQCIRSYFLIFNSYF